MLFSSWLSFDILTNKRVLCDLFSRFVCSLSLFLLLSRSLSLSFSLFVQNKLVYEIVVYLLCAETCETFEMLCKHCKLKMSACFCVWLCL